VIISEVRRFEADVQVQEGQPAIPLCIEQIDAAGEITFRSIVVLQGPNGQQAQLPFNIQADSIVEAFERWQGAANFAIEQFRAEQVRRSLAENHGSILPFKKPRPFGPGGLPGRM
jgi:hypothetical protein